MFQDSIKRSKTLQKIPIIRLGRKKNRRNNNKEHLFYYRPYFSHWEMYDELFHNRTTDWRNIVILRKHFESDIFGVSSIILLKGYCRKKLLENAKRAPFYLSRPLRRIRHSLALESEIFVIPIFSRISCDQLLRLDFKGNNGGGGWFLVGFWCWNEQWTDDGDRRPDRLDRLTNRNWIQRQVNFILLMFRSIW